MNSRGKERLYGTGSSVELCDEHVWEGGLGEMLKREGHMIHVAESCGYTGETNTTL